MVEEIRFAGHPSLGTAVAVARARAACSEARYVQQTVAGCSRSRSSCAGDVARASMLQEPAEFGETIEPAPVLGALGLGPADAHPELPVQPVSTGICHLMVPVRDHVALERARPDAARASRRSRRRPTTMVLYLVRAATTATTPRPRAAASSPSATTSWRTRRPAAPPGRCAPTCTRTPGGPRRRSPRASRWDARARLETAIVGDRVRVAGDCVVVLDGDLRV